MSAEPTVGQSEIDEAVARLRNGEQVVMPTETVYGLAADAKNPMAVQGIFRLKGRPPSRPLIVHLATAAQLDDWARDIPAYARRLAEHFWPGPLTLVLKRAADVPDAVTGGQDTVALRVPQHPLALTLLDQFGGGLAAPSANRYGHISPTTADHVKGQFGAETPLILDGGPCHIGIESTIVSCLGQRPEILRPGMLDSATLAAALGESRAIELKQQSEVRVPGQTLSHYAPNTPTYMVAREASEAWAQNRPGRGGFLGFSEPPVNTAIHIALSPEPAQAARQLYAALHQLDAAGLDWILIETPPATAAWTALRDRLTRACAPKSAEI
ncbi:threonylcarbamoyl-AMP synthase [Alkalilimnicola ehrlichii]|uniref:Threonylcarbamoyl-AMP synthase n=1 Tax=Alkalilimnicola ehrlichii TaxID=351052 RepID=A0A3E0WKS4_9GAMM|nr:L-threonylcarbamoyladenylate synthase [Alkalilimnicola ehrlichii]RFA25358.1 threonylcarbamoyl-AMP synthase [Alkalilimnicola ehrlichii]RFA32535.1 threonylcarbamoyl-AMP synthase [Alkalilimnicola ehrlichii]